MTVLVVSARAIIFSTCYHTNNYFSYRSLFILSSLIIIVKTIVKAVDLMRTYSVTNSQENITHHCFRPGWSVHCSHEVVWNPRQRNQYHSFGTQIWETHSQCVCPKTNSTTAASLTFVISKVWVTLPSEFFVRQAVLHLDLNRCR